MRGSDVMAVLYYGFILDASEAQALGEQILEQASPEDAARWQGEWAEPLYEMGMSDPMGREGSIWTFGANIETVDGDDGDMPVDVSKLSNEWLADKRKAMIEELEHEAARTLCFEQEWRIRLSVEMGD